MNVTICSIIFKYIQEYSIGWSIKYTNLEWFLVICLLSSFCAHRDTPMPPSHCVRSSDWAETRCSRSRAAQSPTHFWPHLRSMHVFIYMNFSSQCFGYFPQFLTVTWPLITTKVSGFTKSSWVYCTKQSSFICSPLYLSQCATTFI